MTKYVIITLQNNKVANAIQVEKSEFDFLKGLAKAQNLLKDCYALDNGNYLLINKN